MSAIATARRHGPDPLTTYAAPASAVEIETDAAPDALSRVLEPLVVMQATARRVDARLLPGGSAMAIRIDLGADTRAAKRLALRLSSAVTVRAVRLVAGGAPRVVPA